MPVCETRFHGPIRFEPAQVLHMPGGLFGFPDETEFLLLELPSMRPLAFVQSVRTPQLCFLSLPAQVIAPDYQLNLPPDAVVALGYKADQPPVMGKDVLCLALLTVRDQQETTANLIAPLVIDIARHRGMQVLVNAPYSHCHRMSHLELAHPC